MYVANCERRQERGRGGVDKKKEKRRDDESGIKDKKKKNRIEKKSATKQTKQTKQKYRRVKDSSFGYKRGKMAKDKRFDV